MFNKPIKDLTTVQVAVALSLNIMSTSTTFTRMYSKLGALLYNIIVRLSNEYIRHPIVIGIRLQNH